MGEVILAYSKIQNGQSTLTDMASEFACSEDTLSQSIKRLCYQAESSKVPVTH